jgi:hypothetical protein
MAAFVQRVTLVNLDVPGDTETVQKSKRKKKRKVSGFLKPMAKRDRRMARASKAFSDEWLSRMDRSNRKRRNGWLRDAPVNLMRANRKATKRLFKF